MIPFPEWAPDVADYNTEVASVAVNCYPIANGYRNLRDWSEKSNASGGTHEDINTGGFVSLGPSDINRYWVVTEDGSGNPKIYYDNATSIEQGSLTWVPALVSGVASQFEYFLFIEWDDDILFFGRFDTPQKTSISSPATTTDIGGTPPAARCGARVRQQLVLGYLYESSTLYKNRLRWSAFGDYEGWTAGTNLSGFEDDAFANGGLIMDIVGGEHGLVFQQHQIVRMDFIGAPNVWEFNTVEENRGAVGTGLAVKVGPDTYYLAHDGFHVIRDGQRSEPIGANRVDEYFWSICDSSSSQIALVEKWSAAYDVSSHSVWWCVTGATAGTWHYFIYNIKADRWSEVRRGNTTELFEQLVTSAVKQPVQGDNAMLKDSIVMLTWSGTKVAWYDMSGSDMAAIIQTGTIFDEQYKSYLEEARIIADGDWTLKLLTKADSLDDTEVEGSAISRETEGHFPCDSEARYHRLQFTSASDWTKASGATVKQSPAGEF